MSVSRFGVAPQCTSYSSPVRHCGLTPRSSGAPTAGHQARSGGTRYIFASPGLASCRCRPLSSNVRRQPSQAFKKCIRHRRRPNIFTIGQHRRSASMRRALWRDTGICSASYPNFCPWVFPSVIQLGRVVVSRALVRLLLPAWHHLRSPFFRGFVRRAPPNPSLNRTRYGRRRKAGVRRLRHLRTRALRRLP